MAETEITEADIEEAVRSIREVRLTGQAVEVTDNRAHRAAMRRLNGSIHLSQLAIDTGRAEWVDDILVCR